MNIVLIGKSATGKNTIATIISENFRYDMAINAKEFTKTSNKIGVMKVVDLIKAKERNLPIVTILINASEKTRIIRQLDNGDDIMDIAIQNKIDEFEFHNIDSYVDYVVPNDGDNTWKPVDDILQIIASLEK